MAQFASNLEINLTGSEEVTHNGNKVTVFTQISAAALI